MTNNIQYNATYDQISCIVVLWMHYNKILTIITYALNS